MKKILAILICLMLAVCLVACGETSSSSSSNDGASTPTTDSLPNTGNSDNFEKELVSVSFDLQGGAVIYGETKIEIEKNTCLSVVNTPDVSRGGYIFTYWSYDPQGNVMWSSSDPLNTDTVLYANWQALNDTEDSTTDSSTPDSGTTDSSKPNSDTTDSSKPNSGTTDSSTTDSSKPNSGTTDSSTTSSSTTDSSKDDSGDVDVPVTPKPQPDRTVYEPKVVESGSSKYVYYLTDPMLYPQFTSYYNGYKAALSMTFDDGYDLNTGTIISDQFEKYGFRGTMMIGPCFINGDNYITGWNSVFDRGFLDLGCHGYNHKEPTTLDPSEYEHEIKDAIMYLREKFPTQRVLTFATPYAHINDSYEEYLSQFVIGNRLESGGQSVTLGKEFNHYRVMAVSVNKNASLSTVHSIVANSIKSGKWTVELFHCVLENASNSTDISREVFEFHCKYLYQKFRDDIWFASFEDVMIYAYQLEHVSVDYTACDRESMTFTVTPDGTLDKEIYNFPLSLKVYLPNKLCDSAYAEVNGVYQPLVIEYEEDTGYKYTIVREIPYTEAAQVKVYLGGNSTMKNYCIPHKYSVVEVVEPTHDTYGYKLYECSKCLNTYKSEITNPVHDYSGEETVVIEATETQKGLSKFKCLYCDKYEVREVAYVPPVIETVSFKGETILAPTLTPYYNNYEAAISFSLDDGYDGSTATNVSEVMEKYNMRCTAMLNPCFIENKPQTIAQWSEAFKKGYL